MNIFINIVRFESTCIINRKLLFLHAYVLLCFVYLYIYKTPDTRVNNVEKKKPAKVKSHNCIENMTHFFNETVNYDKALPKMGTQPTIRNLI